MKFYAFLKDSYREAINGWVLQAMLLLSFLPSDYENAAFVIRKRESASFVIIALIEAGTP